MRAELGAQPARQVDRRVDPHDPGQDGREADRQPEPDQALGRKGRQRVEDPGQLHPDQQEGEPIDHEQDDDQTPMPISRPFGDSTRAARRPAMIPAVTTARTPLTPIVAAGM